VGREKAFYHLPLSRAIMSSRCWKQTVHRSDSTHDLDEANFESKTHSQTHTAA
jgi:hypothetical protein